MKALEVIQEENLKYQKKRQEKQEVQMQVKYMREQLMMKK